MKSFLFKSSMDVIHWIQLVCRARLSLDISEQVLAFLAWPDADAKRWSGTSPNGNASRSRETFLCALIDAVLSVFMKRI